MKTTRFGCVFLTLFLAMACSTSPSRKTASVPASLRLNEAALHFRNEEALKAKLALIRGASTQIDMAYYIMEADPSSSLIALELLKAAEERNVRVRLIVDYFQSQKELPILRLLASHRMIQVRRFGAPTDGFLAAMEAAGIDAQEFVPALTSLNPANLTGILAQSTAFRDASGLRALLARDRKDISMAEVFIEASNYARTHPELMPFVAGFRAFLRWNHFKLTLADRACFVMGGRNLSDQYHASHGDALLRSRAYAFQDLDMSGCEDGEQQLLSFESVWNAPSQVALEAKVFEKTPAPALTRAELERRAASAQHLFRSSARARSYKWTETVEAKLSYNRAPIEEGDNSAITQAYIDEIRKLRAGERLDFYNAYFFLNPEWAAHEGGGPRRTDPLRDLYQAILAASRAGVDIRIHTNSVSSTDLNIVNFISFPVYRELRRAGVRLFELAPGQGSLHMKGATFAQRGLAVGSYNLDPRSHLYDTNNVVFIDDVGGEGVQALRDHVGSLRWNEMREPELQRLDAVLSDPATQARIQKLRLIKELI